MKVVIFAILVLIAAASPVSYYKDCSRNLCNAEGT